jgi:hypothetical protein
MLAQRGTVRARMPEQRDARDVQRFVHLRTGSAQSASVTITRAFCVACIGFGRPQQGPRRAVAQWPNERVPALR